MVIGSQAAPFTREAMNDELRTILLFTADHLAMSKSSAAAASFIGFEAQQYFEEPPSRVDLEAFRISATMQRIYDYACQVGDAAMFSEDDLQDAFVFIEGAPKIGGQEGESGVVHAYSTPEGLCRRAIDTAAARWALECDTFRSELSVRDLALLANMTEGAVRNALAAAGVKAGGSRTLVDKDFANGWLAGRRGFVPTTCWEFTPERANRAIATALTLEAIGDALRDRMSALDISLADLSTEAGAPQERLEAWLRGRIDAEVDVAVGIAKALDLDAPAFAGRLVELKLRLASS